MLTHLTLAATYPPSAFVIGIVVFVLAVFIGFELISKVPSRLHTPLMSGSNAISGITIVGALLCSYSGSVFGVMLAFLGIVFATTNVVGGYLVTDRMLKMFQHKEDK
ncbi:NAD(P) transhydrogenase subunit alpha [Algisphaera agarilytica]|uniref:proton-translocating NAD(P)(+) transhydrogenase n=1 Tax=Algisphaera agarilytica TaxID=1385975 RepID=A0A7X0H648_9BACT|nr:NAD(P) transhydrogenase subunit alpha [Algisphaera agarilytica]MBB6428500.1 NAD(P) transhydrogenase subunit alpha [Algisphaera agarilytica]